MNEPPVAPQPSPARERMIGITIPTLVIITAFAGLVWALVAVRSTVLTLFFALFAATVLEPVVRFTQRKLKVGRGAASTIIVLGLVGVGLVIAFILIAPFVDAMRNFVDSLPKIVEEIRDSSIGAWVDKHSQAGEVTEENVKDVATAIGHAAGGILGVTVSAFTLVLGLVTAIFLTLFLIIDLPRLLGGVDSLLDPGGSERMQRVVPQIVTAVSRSMLGNIAISIICGTLYGLSAWALGLPSPLALAFISGFLDLIPTIGATISGTILVLIALTQGVPEAVIMLAIVLIYQQIENYALQPTILGKAADVSGFLVIASVLIFGTLLGVVGAIIAVPIVASIQIIVIELTANRRAQMAALRAPKAEPAAPS
jgi:predicted PurR-regulated permease PerM